MSAVNYIAHHKNVNIKMISDESISTIDIAIYNALFLLWNSNGFCETLSISRSEVMQLSKVGNANTYTSSLKRLHSLGYIVYSPSNNPLIGSKVTIIKCDKGSGKSSDISGGKSSDNTTDTSSGASGDTLYKHYNTITHKHIETLLNYFDSLQESEIQKKINDFLKEEKPKVKTLEERKKDFGEKLTQFKVEYSNDMLLAFYNYWTEHGDNDKKMRFEKEKTFGVTQRLATWNRNNFGNKSNNNNNHGTEQRIKSGGVSFSQSEADDLQRRTLKLLGLDANGNPTNVQGS